MSRHDFRFGETPRAGPHRRRALTRRRVLGGALGMAGAGAIGGGLSRPDALGDFLARAAAQDESNAMAVIREVKSKNGLLNLRLQAHPDPPPNGALGYAWSESLSGPLTAPDTPGPTLRLRRGDRLRIRLENLLAAETNLHVHGLHVSPSGNSDNVFVHVPAIHEGAAAEEHPSWFDFEYLIPEDHRPGFFWYHPHLHGTTAPQVGRGLAGAIIIEESGAADDPPGLADALERVIVLQQLRSVGYHVNGMRNPTLSFFPGTRERWRLLNATSNLFLNLYLDGHPFHRIAVDGNWLQTPVEATILPLGPAERAEILIDWRSADSYGLSALQPGVAPIFEKLEDTPVTPLATLRRADAAGLFGATPEAALAPPDYVLSLADLRDVPGVPQRLLDFQSKMDDAVFIDDKTFHAGRVDQTVQLGGVEEWIIKNTSNPDLGWHPLHVHVNDFQVLSITASGYPTDLKPVWYTDTVPLPPDGEVTIRAVYPDFPGRFVYHCHFLDHEDMGMMGVVDVAETVRISGSTLSPPTTKVIVGPAVDHVVNGGVSVAWTNLENDVRRVVSRDTDPDTGEPLFASGALAQGESFVHIFDAPGDYRYRCVSTINPSLDGRVQAAAEQTIDIVDGVYQPNTITLAVGATVTWSNRESAPHTATADALDGSGAPLFDTGQLGQRASRSHTFAAPGNYPYHDALNPGLTGEVRVRPVTRQSVSLPLGDTEIALPDSITVFKDSTITWANRGKTAWDVTVDGILPSQPLDPEQPLAPGRAFSPGQRFIHTFTSPGVYSYTATSLTAPPTTYEHTVKVIQPVEIIAYGDFAFEPQDVMAFPPGAEIVWINRDDTDHDIVVHPLDDADGEPLFASGPIGPGERRGFAFASPSRFVFRATDQPDLVGTVFVE